MARSNWFQRYLLPGVIFQSVVIGGGYGTGRELAEFFLGYGPLGGLLAMLAVSMVVWSLVSASTYEFARVFKAFDYRSFFQRLLGPAWILFEVLYLLTLLLVVAVASSASGTILKELFGAPYLSGVLGMLLAVAILVSLGSSAIERFLASWSVLLYLCYLTFFVSALVSFGDQIWGALADLEVKPGWFMGGVRYAAYNLGVIPAVLFSIRHCRRRREAICAGLLSGPIAIFPGVLFFLTMCGHYPEILPEALPANFLLEKLEIPGFQIFFQMVLLGTLMETGVGFIHAFNERVDRWFREQGTWMRERVRAVVAGVLLVLGALLAQFGLVNLIAEGYGRITWGFLLVFVLPVLTVGWWKIARASDPRA